MASITTLTASQQAQFFYVTYYGRPADPAGLSYWAGVIGSSGLESAARDFAKSDEAKVKYPSLGSTSDATQLKTDIQALYKTVFGRDPLATNPATGLAYDAAGLDYWYAGVVAGDFSFAQLPIILYDAAAANPVTQQDVVAIGNRQDAAKSFTESLKTPAQIAAYSGQTAVTSSSTWLATVDYRTESLTAAVATKSDLIFNLVINPDKPNTASPVVAAASVSVNEGAVASGAISATDADGTTLIYSADAASAQGGTVAINASTGAFTYTPKADFAGTDSFKVSVSDGQGGVTVSTVSVTVKEVNEVKPTATLAATEDSVASGKIDFINPGAETLVAVVKTQGAHGTIAFVANATDGSYTYTPKADYNGSDTFVIQVTDGTKVSTQQVTVTVAAVNDSPVIATAAETISVTEDVAFTTGMVGATDADTKDASPDVITYTAAGASKGTVTFTAAGDYTYTPKANANGEDSFVITATDKAGATATKTVAVNIASVNDAPVAAATSAITTDEDVTVSGAMNATDGDANDTLSYTVATAATKGTVALAADGTYVYTPNKDANGADSFVLSASDGTATVSQTVSVTIAAKNDAPVLAATATATVLEDKTLSAAVAATDPDTGDTLSYAIKTAPGKGTATISAAGVISYTPELNYAGADSLVVEVTDTAGAKSEQTLSITVTPDNDLPVAASGTASVVGGAAVTIPLADLISDIETAKDKLQIVDVIASRGNVSVSGTNLVYTAQAGGANTTDTVYFTVQDEGGAKSNAASISVSIVTRTGGTSGNDVLGGSTAAEEIAGLAGDDFINGGGGYDLITAGTGNDTVVFSTQAAQILGGAGTDTLKLPTVGDLRFDLTSTTNQYVGLTRNAFTSAETVTVLGFENIDASAAQVSVTIKGATEGSTLIGGDLGDSIVGGAGNDSLEGGLDNDTLTGGGGIDIVRGGEGNDQITAAGMLYGDKGADTITLAGASTVWGGDNNDSIAQTNGGSADSISQVIYGDDGNDIISLTAVVVTVDGGAGNDSISIDGGDTLSIIGGAGADTIRVDGLKDYISGGNDNDLIVLTTSAADTSMTVIGGSGVDTVQLSGDSIIGAVDLRNISEVEVLNFSFSGLASVTLNGDSATGLSGLTQVNLDGSDSIVITKLTQQIIVDVANINDVTGTYVSADSTTGSIVVRADSIGADDTVIAAGADDFFRDTVGSGASYVFTNAGGLEFIELTGAKANVNAAVSIVSGQSVSLTSVTGDSVTLSVALVGFGAAGTADTVTVTGGSLGDTVNLAGAEKATVYGGSGNDSIDASGALTTSLYGDDGVDTIVVGAFDSVWGGSGDDLIILAAGADSTTYIDGGAGNDAVRVSGGGSITSTLVSVEYLDLTSATANGLDVAVTLQGSSFGQVSVDGDTLSVTNTVAGSGAATIVLSNGTGDGDTAVRITADSLSDVAIIANTGIDSSDVISVAAGVADSDVITGSLARASSAVSYNLSNVTGIDSLTLSRSGVATASATATVTTGADSIIVSLTSSTADSIALNLTSGTGSVTVTSGEMADIIDVQAARRGTIITTNGGADSVNAQNADSVSDLLDLGSGNDTALVSGRDTVLAQAGNDSIIGAAASGADSLVIDAGSGDDRVSINGANDSVLGGDGNDLIVLTGTTLSTATITGGSGNDTVRLTGAVSSTADSIFTNISADVLDLAADTVTQSIAIGSIAAANGIETVYVGAGDSVTMTSQDSIVLILPNVAASISSAASMRISADSLTAVTFRADSVADAFGSQDTISLSAVNTGDVLVISGNASATYNLTNVTGLDSIHASTTAGAPRTLTITGLGSDSVTSTSITAADTATTLDVTIASRDAVTFTLTGNTGADKITATAGGTLVVDLGRGADSVVAGLGSDNIRVNSSVAGDTADANYVFGGGGNDVITGGVGNDIIEIGASVAASISGASLVTAGSGNDSVVVAGDHGADTVYLGAGNDTLVAGSDTAGVYVDLGSGADSVVTYSGNDVIVISTSDLGDTRGDIVSTGSGRDSIVLGAGADTVDAGAGNDTVSSGSGHDTITAGTGDDSIDAGAGNDTVNLSAGGNNRVLTGDGADSVLGGAGADYVDLSALVSALGDSNWVDGGDSTDTLIGGSLNDTIIGGNHNDSIVAGGGNDSVNAGPGADYVDLGDGNDTFVVDNSSDFYSQDAVTQLYAYDTIRGGAGTDTVLLKGSSADLSLSYASLQFTYDIEAFQLEGSGYKSSVVVSNDLFNQSLSLSFSGANTVEVNDTNVTETGSVSIELGSGVAAASVIAAANLAESISAVAGDSLDGGDLYFRGQLADEVYFREFTVNPNTAEFNMTNVSAGKITLGADTGGYVIDLDNSFNGVDVVVAISGADSLADSTAVYWNSDGADSVGVTITTRLMADSIVTGDDNDSISSGSGHDTISAGSGLDTVDAGAGNDLVSFASDTLGYDYINLGVGNDTLEVTGSAVRVGAYVTVGGGADSVNLASSSGSDVIVLVAADTAGDWISAGAGNDSVDLSLSSGADTVLLGTGRDSVWTGGGNDSVVLDGDTAGTDYVYLGSGDDTVSSTADTSPTYVSLGTGADRVVFGGNAADTVVNDSGDTAGDYVNAGSGADLIDLSAGTGNDTVLAGAGNDTINVGAGRDTVTPGTGLDIIDLGADTVTDIVIIADTLLSGGNESFVGRVDVISNFVKGTDAVNFAHELSLTSATTFIADSQAGATGSEPMFDSLGMLTISLTPNVGLNGAIGEIEAFSRSSNAISSGSGLTQGEAFAFEYGGSTYVAVAKGTDSIGSVVQISGVTGVTSLAQVWSEAIGDSISASYAATLVLGAGPDTLIASGNNVMTVTDRGGANYISLVASTASNSVTLGAGADTVLAGFGADTVSLGSGNDWIQFGAAESLSGSDKIDGGAGNDTLYFAAAVDLSGGESADSKFGGLTSIEAISLFNGTNKFILGDSQNASGIVSIFGGTGSDSVQIAASSIRGALAVQLGSGDDTIALTGAANLADSVFTLVRGVEVLDLATGQNNAVTLGSAALTAGIVVIDGSSGSDSINASAYTVATTVIAGDGSDVITLGSAGDVIRFGGDSLTSADTIALGGGIDTIQLESADTISGELQFVSGAEVLVLASGSNIIDLRSYGATAGILTVIGGGGADSVNASNYADTLSLYVNPGAGSDSIYLGSGNDLIVFGADSLGSGDLVVGGAGRDTLQILGADTVLSADFANVSGIEVLQLGSGSNVIELAQAASISTVYGNTGADSINASGANIGVYISGDSSNDWIYTANSADTIDAGVGNDWVFAGGGADTVYGRAGADSVDGGDGADYLDLGTGADTAYLGDSNGAWQVGAGDTLGDGAADLVIFDLTDIGTADSFSDVVFNFTVGLGGDSIGGFAGYNLADSVSQWVEGGFLLNGLGADTAFSSLSTAITWIEANDGDGLKYDLDPNEVFLFRVGTDSYIGTTNGTTVTSVVKLVGVGPAAAGNDLKESSTDGIFYIGPNGG